MLRPYAVSLATRVRLALVACLALVVVVLVQAAPAQAAPPTAAPPSPAAPAMAATGTGSISGTVTDAATGNPLSGVTVTLGQPEQVDPAPNQTTSTDANGHYRFDGLVDTGSYAVAFRVPGSTYLPEAWPNHHSWEGWEPIALATGENRTGIDAALDQGVGVDGLITDASGTPVAGMCLTAYASSDTDFSGDSTCTDADGRFSATALADTDITLTVFDDTGTYVALTYPGPADPALRGAVSTRITGLHVVLSTGASVGGRVTDAAGTPLADICVRLDPTDGSYVPQHTACSGADGRYSSAGVPSGVYRLTFYAYGRIPEQFYPGTIDLPSAQVLTLTAPEHAELADAVLTSGASVSGTITAAGSGQPIEGCIQISPVVPGQGSWGNTCAGADGTYSFGGLVAASYTVSFTGPYATDYLPADYTDPMTGQSVILLADGQTRSGVDAALTLGGSISGTMTTTNGPVTGTFACATAYRPNPVGWPASVGSACADDAGHYTVHGLPFGDYLVEGIGGHLITQWYDHASGPGTATPVSLTEGASATGIDFVLEHSYDLYVTAQDASTFAAVGGIEVIVQTPGTDPVTVGTTGADGSASATTPAPGIYTVRLHDPQGRYADWWYPSGDEAGAAQVWLGLSPTYVTGRLTPPVPVTSTVAGTVTVHVGGQPLAGITVRAYAGDSPTAAAEATTDANGTYTLTGLAAGSYVVSFTSADGHYRAQWWQGAATRPAATAVVVPASQVGVDAALDVATFTASGVVTAAGTGSPVAGASVAAYPEGGSTAAVTTTTTPNGAYSLTLPDGTYTLKVTTGDGRYHDAW